VVEPRFQNYALTGDAVSLDRSQKKNFLAVNDSTECRGSMATAGAEWLNQGQ
jgi:hypothetical protein